MSVVILIIAVITFILNTLMILPSKQQTDTVQIFLVHTTQEAASLAVMDSLVASSVIIDVIKP